MYGCESWTCLSNNTRTICKTTTLTHNLQPVQKTNLLIAGRNINNLRYADDTTLMAESEEELKSLLMKVKEKRVHEVERGTREPRSLKGAGGLGYSLSESASVHPKPQGGGSWRSEVEIPGRRGKSESVSDSL